MRTPLKCFPFSPLWFDNGWIGPCRRRLMTLTVKGNWLAGIIPFQVTCVKQRMMEVKQAATWECFLSHSLMQNISTVTQWCCVKTIKISALAFKYSWNGSDKMSSSHSKTFSLLSPRLIIWLQRRWKLFCCLCCQKIIEPTVNYRWTSSKSVTGSDPAVILLMVLVAEDTNIKSPVGGGGGVSGWHTAARVSHPDAQHLLRLCLGND